MMTQVAGRSVDQRARESNHTDIQPDHNTIQQVTTTNYEGMYKDYMIDKSINTHLILELLKLR
jgi:hypothetical protein